MQTEAFVETLKRSNIAAFHLNDAVKILKKPRRYVSLFLHRAVKKGVIKRAEKGLYYPSSGTNGYAIASAIASPSYISMVSALHYHGLTTQIPRVIYVLSTTRHRPLHGVLGYDIVFRRVKREMMFGYRRKPGSGVMIADPEKALIDIFYFDDVNDLDPDALEKPPRMDIATLVSYAIKSNNPKVIEKTASLLADYGYANEAEKLSELSKRLKHDR